MAKKEQTYKQAIAEVEKILADLESNSMDVDEMANAVKKAMDLLSFCKKKLRDTEEDIIKLLEE
jgi:exodeoxyribonuclease VII small subunit